MTQNLTTELVCTRLSHDMAGNIGAVANAVELLEEGDLDFLDDIKSILKHSSQTLAARLKFFRMVFGLDNANLDSAETVAQTARDYLASLGNKDYPIGLDFAVNMPQNRKPALRLIMILADVLIRGGEIRVSDKDGKIAAEVVAASKIAADKLERIRQAVDLGYTDPDAAMAPLCALLEEGRKLQLETDGLIRLIVE